MALCAAAVMVVVATIACSDTPTEPRPASLELEPGGQVTLDFRFTETFEPVLRDGLGRVMDEEVADVTWTSSDSTIVRVDSTGLAEATGPGTATVRAELGEQRAAVEVIVPRLQFAQIVPGGSTTCAVTVKDLAYCWGWNGHGALGNGTTDGDSVPAPVAGGHRFRAVSSNSTHACGLTREGKAYCWGKNAGGKLGNGVDDQELTTVPTEVVGGLSFATIQAGGRHTCGLTPGGKAYCWGNNNWGRLGDGGTASRSEPTEVAGGLTFESLWTGGASNCAVTPEGKGYCWGKNVSGEVGDGTQIDRLEPTAVAGDLVFHSIRPAVGRTCGLTVEGRAYCWGGNYRGALGDGTEIDRLTPTPVAGDLTFQTVGVGSRGCGLTSNGTVYCWGSNLGGLLGQPYPEIRNSSVPLPIAGNWTFTSLDVTDNHACGRATDGLFYCWGANVYGRLGIGTWSGFSHEPVPIFGQQ